MVGSDRQMSSWPSQHLADGEALPSPRPFGRLRPRLQSFGGGRRRARQPPARPLLRQSAARRRLHVFAGRAVDGGASPDPDAHGDAQQPRLPPGSHARPAPVQSPQPGCAAWARPWARSAPRSKPRISTTRKWRRRWVGGRPVRSRIRRSSRRRSSGRSRWSSLASRLWSTSGRSRAEGPIMQRHASGIGDWRRSPPDSLSLTARGVRRVRRKGQGPPT